MGMDLMLKTLFMEDFKMRRRMTKIIQCFVFLNILFFTLWTINKFLIPKQIYRNNTWPTTSTYNQFYKMEKDSIDVIFQGSSVCVNAFSPQEIYNNYGIRSYNLGSEQQSVLLSYYWLKEALQTQSPQVVVLDTRFVFMLHPENPLNSTEASIRKCLDPMKWSKIKMEAVKELCAVNPSQTALSFYLTNIRFHTRWTELTEYDLNLSQSQSSELKGYSAIATYGPESYSTFDPKDNTPIEKAHPIGEEYLLKIINLCKENDIELILVSLPQNAMNDGINNYLNKISSDYSVDYYNFCETSNYNALNVTLPRESALGHENIWGAIKMSQYIGKLLSEKYHIKLVFDKQWEDTREYYEQIKKNCELSHITDFAEYLKAINDDSYTVFISIKDEGTFGLSDICRKQLKDLGLKTDFIDKYRYSYYAIIDSQTGVIEKSDEDLKLTYKSSVRDNNTMYSILSAGYNAGPSSSIIIDGTEYSKNGRGMNFVIYDKVQMKVIDQVRFDTSIPEMTAYR